MGPVPQAVPTEQEWSAEIQRVLEEPARVKPAFQPIVDLERGVAIGYEMLARFESDIDAAPPAWLAEADRRGLASRLEATLVETGLAALDWVPDNCFVAINVSPRALGAPELAAVLASRESLEGVVIEVTEQVVSRTTSLRVRPAVAARRGRGDRRRRRRGGLREPPAHRLAAAAVREARQVARREPRERRGEARGDRGARHVLQPHRRLDGGRGHRAPRGGRRPPTSASAVRPGLLARRAGSGEGADRPRTAGSRSAGVAPCDKPSAAATSAS